MVHEHGKFFQIFQSPGISRNVMSFYAVFETWYVEDHVSAEQFYSISILYLESCRRRIYVSLALQSHLLNASHGAC